MPKPSSPVAAIVRLFTPGVHGLGVLPPVTAVIELSAIVALLLLADWLFPTLAIDDLQPSVFWLPVLLLSLQYGTASGSLAAMVAIVAYFALSTQPDQGVGENEFAFRLRVLAQPILWIATAVFLGQFRMVQIAAKQELTRRVRDLEAEGRTLAGYATSLRARCDALERDIVSRSASEEPHLLGALATLRDPSSSAAASVAGCLAVAARGGTVSVFARVPAGLVRAVSAGWLPDAPWLELVPGQSPLALAVIGTQRSLCVLDAADDAALSSQGLAAVPIIEQPSGRVIGMLKVEAAASASITPQLTGELAVLAAAIAPRLGEISHGPGALSGAALGPFNTVVLRPAAKLDIFASADGSRDGSRDGSDSARPVDRVWPKAGL